MDHQCNYRLESIVLELQSTGVPKRFVSHLVLSSLHTKLHLYVKDSSCKRIRRKEKNNRAVLVKLLRSIYLLAKNRIPHTSFSQLLEQQVTNGNEVFPKHLIDGLKMHSTFRNFQQ